MSSESACYKFTEYFLHWWIKLCVEGCPPLTEVGKTPIFAAVGLKE